MLVVVNIDQDVVARGAKFVAMYKRGGHRVLINKLGDLIVRPSAMETSIRLVPCSGSVQQHLLTSYLQSLLAVLVAQFTNKKMKGGMAGVVQLAKESIPLKVKPTDSAIASASCQTPCYKSPLLFLNSSAIGTSEGPASPLSNDLGLDPYYSYISLRSISIIVVSHSSYGKIFT